MESKIQMSLIQPNIKIMLPIVMVIFTFYNFISDMMEESQYCSVLMKKHFSKELVMTEKNNEDFENFTKCWICDNDYIDDDVKVRDHFHVTGKYRGSANRYFNINVKLNQ